MFNFWTGVIVVLVFILMTACTARNNRFHSQSLSKKFIIDRAYKDTARCVIKGLREEEYGIFGGTIEHDIQQVGEGKYIVIRAKNPERYQLDIASRSKDRSVIQFRIKETQFLPSMKERLTSVIQSCQLTGPTDQSLPDFLTE